MANQTKLHLSQLAYLELRKRKASALGVLPEERDVGAVHHGAVRPVGFQPLLELRNQDAGLRCKAQFQAYSLQFAV